jgi:hypothetical protein
MGVIDKAKLEITRRSDGAYVFEMEQIDIDGDSHGGIWIIEGHRFSHLGPLIADPKNALHQLWITWTNT